MESQAEVTMRCCLSCFHGGRVAEAERIAAEGVRAFPDHGGLWQLHGLLLQRAGDFERACDALEMAGLLVPLSPAAQCALADCHARAGRCELARDLHFALASGGACPTGLMPLVASGLGRAGEYAAALEVCRELSRREPSHHDALFGMAYYMRLAGHDAASILPVIARALELAPRVAVYRVLRGVLLAQLGRIDEAREAIHDIRPEEIRCSGCLRRVMAILSDGGDDNEVLAIFQEYAARILGRGPQGPC